MGDKVVVTAPCFLVSGARACGPHPNDNRRGLRTFELLGGTELRPQACSHHKPAQPPVPTWGSLSGSPLRNKWLFCRPEFVEAPSTRAVERRYREYLEAISIRFWEP